MHAERVATRAGGSPTVMHGCPFKIDTVGRDRRIVSILRERNVSEGEVVAHAISEHEPRLCIAASSESGR